MLPLQKRCHVILPPFRHPFCQLYVVRRPSLYSGARYHLRKIFVASYNPSVAGGMESFPSFRPSQLRSSLPLSASSHSPSEVEPWKASRGFVAHRNPLALFRGSLSVSIDSHIDTGIDSIFSL